VAESTFELIDSATLTSSAASIDFTGISGSFRDLVLQVDHPTNLTNSVVLYLRFNSDATNSYTSLTLESSGSSTSTQNRYSQTHISPGFTSGYFGESSTFNYQIMDYATSKEKTVLYRHQVALYNANYKYTIAGVARWANTSAITSITITGNRNFDAGLKVNLYGLVG